MNRYRSGGPSKATPTTLCQKCLKKGHYTYECTTSQQERPYTSRPSRTQQLSNPRLAPKLSATLPPADAVPASNTQLKKNIFTNEVSAGRKESPDRRSGNPLSGRRRSVSSHSSDSVSSFSTNRSRSRSMSRTPPRASKGRMHSRDRSVSRSPSPRPQRRQRSPAVTSGRPKRRNSRTSVSSRRVNDQKDRPVHRESGERAGQDRSRSPLHRNDRDNAAYRRRSRSRSPYRGAKDRAIQSPHGNINRKMPQPRERSLSPYSQRLALTKATNG